MAAFLIKSFGECCGSAVLTDASCWPSNNCIPLQKIASVSTELTHNRSQLVLYYGNGLFCHQSSSEFALGFSKLRPAGQIQPTNPFHPAAKHILPTMKK